MVLLCASVAGQKGTKIRSILSRIWPQQTRRVACMRNVFGSKSFSWTRKVEDAICINRILLTRNVLCVYEWPPVWPTSGSSISGRYVCKRDGEGLFIIVIAAI